MCAGIAGTLTQLRRFCFQNLSCLSFTDCALGCTARTRPQWTLRVRGKSNGGQTRAVLVCDCPIAIQITSAGLSLLRLALLQVKRVYSGLLDTREERWAQARGGVADTITELSEFYSAAGPLSRRLADDSLAHWFAHLADQVNKTAVLLSLSCLLICASSR